VNNHQELKKIDLYLGSDLGLWALQQVPTEVIGQIFTFDAIIYDYAKSKGLQVWQDNVNLIEHIPSKAALSVHYPKVLKPKVISKYPKIYNLHPGYLPWGRGYYPIFWALWEETPAGATLHEINAGIDQGAIVAQTRVEYYPYDTGGSLFQRVRQAEKELFLRYWEKIVNDQNLPSFPQSVGGTYHTKQEFMELKTQFDWKLLSGKELIKLIRCLTFDGYSGLEVLLGQQKFEVFLKPLTSK
jgi:methionyl-tRNA formyltransferase